MHFDDLGFEATVPSPRASEPALAVGVGIFVKGVVIPGESAPFAVADWHRAVRLGPRR